MSGSADYDVDFRVALTSCSSLEVDGWDSPSKPVRLRMTAPGMPALLFWATRSFRFTWRQLTRDQPCGRRRRSGLLKARAA